MNLPDLIVFILHSKAEFDPSCLKDIGKSFRGSGIRHFFNCDCETPIEVNNLTKFAEWYMILYDNEIMAPSLVGSLKNLLQCQQYDVYTILKREVITGKIYEAPRIYRRWVKLKDGGLLPDDIVPYRYERVLDGFIIDVGS